MLHVGASPPGIGADHCRARATVELLRGAMSTMRAASTGSLGAEDLALLVGHAPLQVRQHVVHRVTARQAAWRAGTPWCPRVWRGA